jgi:hypothetical protein
METERPERQERDPDEIRALAADIAEQILSGGLPQLLDALRVAARRCPEGQLCCFQGYQCIPASFHCPQRFRCAGGYSSGVQAVGP